MIRWYGQFGKMGKMYVDKDGFEKTCRALKRHNRIDDEKYPKRCIAIYHDALREIETAILGAPKTMSK